MSMRKPVAERYADDGTHNRAGVIHRRASHRQERWEWQEDHTVNSPGESHAVDRHAPFAQAPWPWCWEAALEPSDDDEEGWHHVGGVESESGERGSEASSVIDHGAENWVPRNVRTGHKMPLWSPRE
jgi:hypothetical protein